MATAAAIVDVVRAAQSGHQLQQEARFVAAATTEIPKRLVGRDLNKLRGDPFQRVVPPAVFFLVASLRNQAVPLLQAAHQHAAQHTLLCLLFLALGVYL